MLILNLAPNFWLKNSHPISLKSRGHNLTERPERSEYFLAGLNEGGASIKLSEHKNTKRIYFSILNYKCEQDFEGQIPMVNVHT